MPDAVPDHGLAPDAEPWDDDVADLVAACLAVAGEDWEGFRAVLRNCDQERVLVTAVKLLTEILAEQRIAPGHFRAWARQAARRED